jgi:hypothetical protein
VTHLVNEERKISTIGVTIFDIGQNQMASYFFFKDLFQIKNIARRTENYLGIKMFLILDFRLKFESLCRAVFMINKYDFET